MYDYDTNKHLRRSKFSGPLSHLALLPGSNFFLTIENSQNIVIIDSTTMKPVNYSYLTDINPSTVNQISFGKDLIAFGCSDG